MLLSVIIPVYNGSDGLSRCLASLNPLLRSADAEVIVVDDGSDSTDADETESICCKAGAHCLHVEHRGASSARNAGMAVAKGDFLWFVDADDTAVTSQLAALMASLSSLPDAADVLLAGNMVEYGENNEDNVRFSTDALRRVFFPDVLHAVSHALVRTAFPRATNHTLLFIRRRLLMADGGLHYPDGCALLEDTVFALQVMQKASYIVENKTLCVYCLHKTNRSTTAGAWSDSRSAGFIDDLVAFFAFLHDYVAKYDTNGTLYDLYRCYRYVYLRTLAVKGCPWNHIVQLRDAVEMDNPYTFFERLLFVAPIHKSFSLLCRLTRNRR